VETELIETLLKAAARHASDPGWHGPKADGLLEGIRELRGAPIGVDWTDYVPGDVAAIWDSLDDVARIVAFIAAAEQILHQSLEPGSA
jgi:hypothetical protein